MVSNRWLARRLTRIHLGAASGIALVLAAPMAVLANEAPVVSSEYEKAVDHKVDALLAKMTPEEKAGQLTQLMYFGAMAEKLSANTEDGIKQGKVGSLLLVTDPVERNRLQKIAIERSRLGIPLLFGFDVIYGLHTISPVPLALAASWDPKMVEIVQAGAAAEASAVGVNWTFAPMIDIGRDPRWGRIVEGAGEDPFLASAMAAAQVRGFQGPGIGTPGRILATGKHFAGYGAPMGGRDYDEVDLSDSDLWNVYFPPFKAAITAGVGSIMSAYMSLNGVPTTANRWLLTDVLRKKLGFRGFVVGDADTVNSLVTQGLAKDQASAALRAIDAGLNIEMALPIRGAAMDQVPALLKAGRLSAKQLDDAARPVLRAKFMVGLFEHPYVDEAKSNYILNDAARLDLVRVAAERSAVLLRNDGALLPLNLEKIRSIAVLGPLADDGPALLSSWVFPQNKPLAASILSGIRRAAGSDVSINFVEGVRLPKRTFPHPAVALEAPDKRPPLDEDADIKRAVNAAKSSDVAIMVLGEGAYMIGEGSSRSSFALPGRQQELLDAVVATGKPVIVVLVSARPLELGGSKPAAILDSWYPGSAGGAAIANLLFGAATPGGKLPFTWISDAAQAPNPYGQRLSHKPEDADKRYWNGSSKPTYPFGYGLSYTSFVYSELKLAQPSVPRGKPISLSVIVKNSGTRAGDEVVQLYIHQRYGTSTRPIRELKGFQRINLAAGEARTVEFQLRPEDLSYWSSVTKSWIQDETKFDIWVGGSSDAVLGESFAVTK